MCLRASQVVLVVKDSPANAGDAGSIPGSGRAPRGGPGCPLQYSCLESPMDRGAWRCTVHRVAESQTRLKWLNTHTYESLYLDIVFSFLTQNKTLIWWYVVTFKNFTVFESILKIICMHPFYLDHLRMAIESACFVFMPNLPNASFSWAWWSPCHSFPGSAAGTSTNGCIGFFRSRGLILASCWGLCPDDGNCCSSGHRCVFPGDQLRWPQLVPSSHFSHLIAKRRSSNFYKTWPNS